MILKWLKEKFMDEATRLKLGGFHWYTNGVVDIRVDKDEVEEFLKNNSDYRRGRSNARPKKKENVMEQRPYDYEQELVEQGLGPNWIEPGKENAIATGPMNVMTAGTSKDLSLRLYLVDGVVQMRPNQPGGGMAQSDQRRLVWAQNGNDAIQKYNAYFSSLNNANEIYVVVGAAVSEDIR